MCLCVFGRGGGEVEYVCVFWVIVGGCVWVFDVCVFVCVCMRTYVGVCVSALNTVGPLGRTVHTSLRQ